MMLNAYATSEGAVFLSYCVQSTLHEVLGVIENCEIDPSKLDDPTKLEQNIIRLTESAKKFLDSIYNGRDQMPKSLKNMSSLLYTILSEASVSRFSKYGSSPNSSSLSNASSVSSISPSVQLRPRAGSLKSSSLNPYRISMPPPIDPSSSSLLEEIQDQLTESIGVLSINESKAEAADPSCEGVPAPLPSGPTKWFKRSPSKRSLTRASTTKSKYSPNSSADNMKPPSITTKLSGAELNQSTGGELAFGSSESFTPDASMNQSSHKSSLTVGFLSRPEKVVASFLFLRFFVPGMLAHS